MSLNKGYLTSNNTFIGDECFTPFYGVKPIIKFLPKNKTIWCPFDEYWSAFPRLLKERGYKVIRTCYSENKNFFFESEPENYDIIVSNPPFSIKDKIIKRLYELNKPFAIILPVNSIQGKDRFNFFKNGIQLLTFDNRIGYHKNPIYPAVEGTPFASAYFCRNLLPENLILEHLEKDKRPLR